MDQIELTDERGGENLQRLIYQPGEIVLADRGYARAGNLLRVKEDGVDFIVRTGWNSLKWKHADGSELDLFATLRAQKHQTSEVRVRVEDGKKRLELRLVIWRRSPNKRKPNRSDCSRTPRSAAPMSIHAALRRPNT